MTAHSINASPTSFAQLVLESIDTDANYREEADKVWNQLYSEDRANPVNSKKTVKGINGEENALIDQFDNQTKPIANGKATDPNLTFVNDTNSQITNTYAQEARSFSRLVLGTDGQPISEIAEFTQALVDLKANPDDVNLRNSYNSALDKVKVKLTTETSSSNHILQQLDEFKISSGEAVNSIKSKLKKSSTFFDDAKDSLAFAKTAIRKNGSGFSVLSEINQFNKQTKALKVSNPNLEFATSRNIEITNDYAKDARIFSQMVLGTDGKPTELIENLRKAANKLHFNPDDAPSQRVFNEALEKVKAELVQKGRADNFIIQYLADLKISGQSEAANLVKDKALKAIGLIDEASNSVDFARQAIRNGSKGLRADLSDLRLKSLVVDEGVPVFGLWSSLSNLLRRVPGRIGNWKVGDMLAGFFEQQDTTQLRMIRQDMSRHLVQAGQDFSPKTWLSNLKAGSSIGTSYLKHSVSSLWQGFSKATLKNVTRKVSSIVAPAVAVAGLAKLPGMFGQLSRTFLDFTYAPGAGEAAAAGNYGALTGYIGENAMLTGATALVGMTGLTGALAALIPGAPIIGAILAGMAVFGGTSAIWGGIKHMAKNTIGGNNTQMAANGQQMPNGAASQPITPETQKAMEEYDKLFAQLA